MREEVGDREAPGVAEGVDEEARARNERGRCPQDGCMLEFAGLTGLGCIRSWIAICPVSSAHQMPSMYVQPL